jgi:SLT domain-containing protein
VLAVVDEDDADATIAERAADVSGDASTFLEVLTRLRHALGDTRGKIRVSDAQILAGLDRKSHYATRLIARALRHLGWKRARYRFDGSHAYAYAKGTRLQRETILEVTSGDEGQLVVKQREP